MDIKSQSTFVALGANLPSGLSPPQNALRNALGLLKDYHESKLVVSRFVRSPAFPPGSGPDFVNAVAMFASPKAPRDILSGLHAIETRLGRSRHARWAARRVDLDLLAVGDMVLPDRQAFENWRDLPQDAQRTRTPDQLILPHPRIQDRAFVLVPWAEIAPDWIHPVSGRSVAQMRDALDPAELAAITPLGQGE